MPETFEKERFSESLTFPWWIRKEHRARYLFASQFISRDTVLDCACGTGEGAFLFSKKAKEVIGVDIDQHALTEAARRFNKKNLFFKTGSALHIPEISSFFNTYVSLETIEHIENQHGYLKEATRVLKIDGTFICSTPNRLVTNPGKSLIDKPSNPFHVREYSPAELTILLRKYFLRVEIFGLNQNYHWKVSTLNFIGKLFPGNMATRLHQLSKLLFFTFKRDSSYAIEPLSQKYDYEYLIAICQK